MALERKTEGITRAPLLCYTLLITQVTTLVPQASSLWLYDPAPPSEKS